MKNIRKVRTQDGEISLLLLDGSTIKWSITTACLILNELLALSRHEHVLKEAQNEASVRDAHMFLTLSGKQNDRYRFRTIRLQYERRGEKDTFLVILPPGLPLTLEEAGELRETLREHTRFNGPGVLSTPPELELAEESIENEADAEDDDLCPDFQGKEGATGSCCEDCVYFSECFPEEAREESVDSEDADPDD